MAEKLYDYIGLVGVFHSLRESWRERWQNWKDKYPQRGDFIKSLLCYGSDNLDSEKGLVYEDFSHIHRKKTRKELIRISAAVMGIEFSYAAETAFVSPTLLGIGVEHKHMTLVWALSPLIGFFLTPILGSLSDRCSLNLGRRRPFILCMSLGVLLGLFLVPNGEYLGYVMGDIGLESTSNNDSLSGSSKEVGSHPWGIFFTVLGTVLLDFDADACQSPARTYLLDVTVTDDHARGLSTFTVMAGLGGFFGYALGGINWDATSLGMLLGGHVRAVFTLITIIFVICVLCTITSFREMPLHVLEIRNTFEPPENTFCNSNSEHNYGSINSFADASEHEIESEEQKDIPRHSITPHPDASLLLYLKSIIKLPFSIRILCLTNLFSWMAHVCYSLYFTDFVGEAVFGGSPTALEETAPRQLYEEGIRFGCWGMSMYSLSCACYSLVIEKLINKYRARSVYVGGLLVYSSGMFLMAVSKHKVGVILFSWTAGVMYSTLFTMPYLLIAHYHAKGTFDGNPSEGDQIRGLGTDVAIVSSMVFLAQFILSICMGSIVTLSGTTTAVVYVASGLALCGAISATQVLYLDL